MSAEKKHPEFLTTAKRDSKGRIYSVQPYRLSTSKNGDFYEVPLGSGRWIDFNGREIKGEQLTKLLNKYPKKETPKTMDQLIAEKREKLAALEREYEEKKKAFDDKGEFGEEKSDYQKEFDNSSRVNSNSEFASQVKENKVN